MPLSYESNMTIPHTRSYSETQVTYEFTLPDDHVKRVISQTYVKRSLSEVMRELREHLIDESQEIKDSYNDLAQKLINKDE